MNAMTREHRALWGCCVRRCWFFAAFFAVPMVVVAVASFGDAAGRFTLAHYAKILLDQYHWEVLATTFRIAALTTVWCRAARLSARLVPCAHGALAAVAPRLRDPPVIPLFTSNVVRSFGWMVLLGRNGMVNDGLLAAGLIERPVRLLGTEARHPDRHGLHPAALRGAGGRQRARRRSTTASSRPPRTWAPAPTRTFRHITLPLCMPGVISGAVMVFTLAVSAYVTPALLSGGRVTVFSMLIFQQYSCVFDFNYGGALSMTLLVVTLLLVALAGRLGPRETAA